jgi:hypothetical protein
MPEWQRVKWGCDADAPTPFAVIPNVGEVRRCPRRLVAETPCVVRALREFPHTKGGTWPCAGGTSDQSATYRDAVDLILGETCRLEAEAMKSGN